MLSRNQKLARSCYQRAQLTSGIYKRCFASQSNNSKEIPEKYRAQTEAKTYNSGFSSFPCMKVKDLRSFLNKRKTAFAEMKSEAASAGLDFDLQAVSIIERLPVILPDMEEWESDFYEMQSERLLQKRKEYDYSKLNYSEHQRQDDWVYDVLTFGTGKAVTPVPIDVDLRGILNTLGKVEVGFEEDEEELAAKEDLVKMTPENLGVDDVISDSAFENEDWDLQIDANDTENTTAQAAGFVPEPRITAEDKKKDYKSIRRKLARRTHLIVKVKDVENPDGEPVWRFHGGDVNKGESPYKAALRTAQNSFGEDLDLYFLSKGPSGCIYTKYPAEKQKQTGKYGARVFFYRCQRLDGHVKLNDPNIIDYVWITSDDLETFVPNYESDPYWSYASMFLDD